MNRVKKPKKNELSPQEIGSDSSNHHDDESRTVYLVGDIEESLIKDVVERIITLSEKNIKKPITLIINTLGGDVDDAFMLYDLMKFNVTPIHTVGLGKIMSAGCLLLAAGKKGKRKMGRNARLMYHAAWDQQVGTIFELRAKLEEFERLEKKYDECFAKETGLSIEEVENMYNKHGPTRDHFITAEQALKLGIVDELI